jgi:hypothetical protein
MMRIPPDFEVTHARMLEVCALTIDAVTPNKIAAVTATIRLHVM